MSHFFNLLEMFHAVQINITTCMTQDSSTIAVPAGESSSRGMLEKKGKH